MAELERFKLSNLTWDDDTDEDGFFVFLENFGNIARSTPSGKLLEGMLDSKLRRSRVAQGTSPSYILEAPDFAVSTSQAQASNSTVPPEAEAEVAAEVDDNGSAASDQHSSAYSVGGTFTLGTHHRSYGNLPKAAKTLDTLLYNIFRMNIKGSKQAGV